MFGALSRRRAGTLADPGLKKVESLADPAQQDKLLCYVYAPLHLAKSLAEKNKDLVDEELLPDQPTSTPRYNKKKSAMYDLWVSYLERAHILFDKRPTSLTKFGGDVTAFVHALIQRKVLKDIIFLKGNAYPSPQYQLSPFYAHIIKLNQIQPLTWKWNTKEVEGGAMQTQPLEHYIKNNATPADMRELTLLGGLIGIWFVDTRRNVKDEGHVFGFVVNPQTEPYELFDTAAINQKYTEKRDQYFGPDRSNGIIDEIILFYRNTKFEQKRKAIGVANVLNKDGELQNGMSPAENRTRQRVSRS